MQYKLYGLPHSYYSGKARSYLRLQGIDYAEHSPAHPAYRERILPAIQRSIIPVLETPEGEIIQDTVDIIGHFEARGVRYPAYPGTPLRFIVAMLIEYYGSQAMLKHAMHYRWSYLAEQERFLQHAFANSAAMLRMQSYLPRLGVTEKSIPEIEASFHALLVILNVHFQLHPYLLGQRPTIADYGLFGPMYAHLGRDPVPANIVKQQAPAVFRWLERMQAPNLDTVEYHSAGSSDDDMLPQTLEPLLQHIANDIFPELTDKLAALEAHAAAQQPEDGAPVSDKPHRRQITVITTRFRRAEIEVGVEPYLLYLLQPASDRFKALPDAEKHTIQQYLDRFGLMPALPLQQSLRVDRQHNIEVWRKP
jgi:glutathione S-transferase